jgi:hypothetical protein
MSPTCCRCRFPTRMSLSFICVSAVRVARSLPVHAEQHPKDSPETRSELDVLWAACRSVTRRVWVTLGESGLRSVGNDAHRPHLAIRLRDRDRNRFRVDIQTQKSYVAHDRLLSHVALRWGLQIAA